MDPVKELEWLVPLLDSSFVKKTLGKSQGGCIADFEREVGVCHNNKTFRAFIKNLISEEVLEFHDYKKGIGGTIKTYTVSRRKVMEKIRSNHLGKKMYDQSVFDYTSFQSLIK